MLFVQKEVGTGTYILKCVRNMLPYFHATGHHLYAKSGHLYLQDMKTLHPDDVISISQYFTIRSTEKYWSGVWSDMTIEQMLMRSMHAAGGLTHGRGMKDSVINQWIHALSASSQICDALEFFADVYSATSFLSICRLQQLSRHLRYIRRHHTP